MNLDPRVAMRSLEILAAQCDEIEGRVRILALAIRDIETIASENIDYDPDAMNRIIHICRTGGVRTAIEGA